MYGVNGVGKAFEFDGTYLTFVDTGMTTDTPSHVGVFKSHLFLAFGASLQHSAPAEPFVWSAVIGAAELAAGDTITNLTETTDALIVFCKNKTLGLYGTGVGNWDFPTILEKIGARTDTAQVVAQAVFLDDLGITTLTASQEYGNFAGDEVSELIKDFINTRIETANCSLVSRKDKQYQLFFSDGSGVRVTFSGRKVIGSMPFYFRASTSCSATGAACSVRRGSRRHSAMRSSAR